MSSFSLRATAVGETEPLSNSNKAVRLKTLLASSGRCGKDGFKGEFGVGNSQHKVGKSKNKDKNHHLLSYAITNSNSQNNHE